jgi:hypothetical protein
MHPSRGAPQYELRCWGTPAVGKTRGTMDKNRCMVCAKEGAFEGGICDLCKAIIRGEALEGQHQIRKDADKSLHKEGMDIEIKHRR